MTFAALAWPRVAFMTAPTRTPAAWGLPSRILAATPGLAAMASSIAVVSDDSALTAAIDDAIAANPDVVSKIRDGKVQAAGVLVGAVMKATRGQADAAKVKDLILERLA